MTNNEITSNWQLGYFIAGAIIPMIMFVVFQWGLNMGIRMALNLLEHEYPAAFRFLQKNQGVAKVYPYVISGEK